MDPHSFRVLTHEVTYRGQSTKLSTPLPCFGSGVHSSVVCDNVFICVALHDQRLPLIQLLISPRRPARAMQTCQTAALAARATNHCSNENLRNQEQWSTKTLVWHLR